MSQEHLHPCGGSDYSVIHSSVIKILFPFQLAFSKLGSSIPAHFCPWFILSASSVLPAVSLGFCKLLSLTAVCLPTLRHSCSPSLLSRCTEPLPTLDPPHRKVRVSKLTRQTCLSENSANCLLSFPSTPSSLTGFY